ncbi:hypothetical protein C5167_047358 [Papaver somniferum]|uniref:Uncharacterized protein n=1 Tax=Papaver somniferum TaxID=3469 RepID=A0A4Y7LH56_PAPSO|nr:hypothetical protein C5167_047358 [Papaver somniferum]
MSLVTFLNMQISCAVQMMIGIFVRALNSLPPEQSVEVPVVLFICRSGSGLPKHDVVSRYRYMDLWPCSSKDLDYLAHKEVQKRVPLNIAKTSTTPAKVSYLDTCQDDYVYDPGKKQGTQPDIYFQNIGNDLSTRVLHYFLTLQYLDCQLLVIPAPAAPLAGGTGTTKAFDESASSGFGSICNALALR